MAPHHEDFSSPASFSSSLSQPPINPVARLSNAFESIAMDAAPPASRRPMVPGIYVPTLAFFDPVTEDVDTEATAHHALRLAEAGIAGLVTQGSTGEAVHLFHQERSLITATTREALDNAGFSRLPVIVGCGAQSTRETLGLCKQAAAAGGDYALVLPPAYYQGQFSKETVLEFFTDVADQSPVPILIYNFPGVVAGLDLSSDTITALAKHPNIVGCKLTCGNTGKLNRIVDATRAASISHPGSGFMCLGGSADFTLQTLVGGGSGVVGGSANLAPKTCVRLFDLVKQGQLEDARRLQAVVARGDWAAIQGGVVGTKAALAATLGYGGFARRPLPRPSKGECGRWRDAFAELMALEEES